MEELKVSSLGEAIYPRLQVADTKFDKDGVYTCKLKVKKTEATDMLNDIKSALVDSLNDAKNSNQGKNIKEAPPPYKEDGDNVIFNFKVKASGINSKTDQRYERRIRILDSQKNPIPMDKMIGNGSKIRLVYLAKKYYSPAIGSGVTLQPRIVQVVELKEYASSQGDNLLDKLDGFSLDEEQEVTVNDEADF
tara:strand:+ start:14007 stop:14582 length:576 start_codon:yes stop_codon:yes gene_type:complete